MEWICWIERPDTHCLKLKRGLARGGRYVQLEGNDRPRNVVAIFPSLEVAVACYHSEAYQAALVHAQGAATRDLVVVEAAE